MANDEHLALLRQGVSDWNSWREHNPRGTPDLSWVDLSKADLGKANFFRADLSGANLQGADLNGANLIAAQLGSADLSGANLSGANLKLAFIAHANLTRADLRAMFSWADLFQANLTAANLSGADLMAANLICAKATKANLMRAQLSGANLSSADLTGADLSEARFGGGKLSIGANLSGANLSGASLRGAIFLETVLGNLDLKETMGLDDCIHLGPSVIDFHTLNLSRNLPLSFLRGCGLPDKLIDYLPSVRDDPIQFYSCFISYSAKDQLFAERLHADLQNKGVRCWFAPHDLPIGAKTWDAIDQAIRLRDKLLLILSKASLASDWVEDEVSKAYAEERSRKNVVLFPIRIDNAVMSTAEPWAVKLRDQRNIGDFRQWKKPAEYQKSLERLLRDLNASSAK